MKAGEICPGCGWIVEGDLKTWRPFPENWCEMGVGKCPDAGFHGHGSAHKCETCEEPYAYRTDGLAPTSPDYKTWNDEGKRVIRPLGKPYGRLLKNPLKPKVNRD